MLTSLLPILQGLAAAAVVPLFLSLTKSSLLKDSLTSDLDLAVVFGLGVVASIAASAFLDSVTKQVLRDLEKNKRDLAETKRELAETKRVGAETKRELGQTNEKVDDLEQDIEEGAPAQPKAPALASAVPGGAAPSLTRGQRAVLQALISSKWVRRTLEGLDREIVARDSDLSADLEALTSQGLLRRHEPTATQLRVRWSLSPAGKEIAARL